MECVAVSKGDEKINGTKVAPRGSCVERIREHVLRVVALPGAKSRVIASCAEIWALVQIKSLRGQPRIQHVAEGTVLLDVGAQELRSDVTVRDRWSLSTVVAQRGHIRFAPLRCSSTFAVRRQASVSRFLPPVPIRACLRPTWRSASEALLLGPIAWLIL